MTRQRGALLACMLPLLLPTAASAQFSATPAIVRLTAADRTSEVALVRVRNEGVAAAQFRIYLGDYDQNEGGDFRFSAFGSGRGSCAGRLTAFPESAFLEPGAVQDIRVQIAGGHDACWSLLFVESAALADGQVRVAQRIGVRVISAPAALEPDGVVTAVDVSAAGDSLDVTVGFANLGTVPVELHGAVEIRSHDDGRVVRRAEIGPLGVLPANHRRIPIRIANDLPAGRYLVVPIVDLGADFLAGGQTELTVPVRP